jgi:hypothetical protein
MSIDHVTQWRLTPQNQERAQVCARAAELRAQGWPYRKIAAEFGLASARDAQKAAEMGASFAPPDNVRSIRKFAEDQIMDAVQAAYGLIADPGPLTAPGVGIVKDPETGKPLPDKTVVSQGIARLLDANAQLRRLHGADAPRQSVSMVATMSATEIRALAEQVTAQARDIERAAAPPAIPGTVEPPGDSVP